MIELGIGVIGYGFIGKVHTYAYRNLHFYYDPVPARVRLVGVCTSRAETAERARAHGGFDVGVTRIEELLSRDDVHAVHICTPNALHHDAALAAIAAGKHVYCDKPLARTVEEARAMGSAAAASDLVCQVTFHCRFVPALMRAKQLIERGVLGRVFHFRAAYLHAGYTDPARPMSWRLDKEQSGGGALFDLGAHVVDVVRYLLGDVRRVHGSLRTFIAERPAPDGSGPRPVEVDDLALMQVEMNDGSVGLVEASRLATGSNDQLRIEIHGQKGALQFDLEEPGWLRVYRAEGPEEPYGGERGYTRIECMQRYPKPAVWPGPKFVPGWLRFHAASVHAFLTHMVEHSPASPSFADGVACQEVLHAVQQSSACGRWVDVARES